MKMAEFPVHLEGLAVYTACGKEYVSRRINKLTFIAYEDDIKYGLAWIRCKSCMNTLTDMDYLNAVQL